jgi:hypothetical protein
MNGGHSLFFYILAATVVMVVALWPAPGSVDSILG